MSKRPPQIVTTGLGLIPVVTGAVTMLGVDDPVWLGLGIALLGGIGRLLSWASLGPPPAPFVYWQGRLARAATARAE